MKAIKYLVAGLLVMGLAAPAMAQDVNYKDMLKPIETTLKAGNADPKAFAKEIKEYQKEFKKDPKALVALGNLLAMNKSYDQANAVADAVIAKFKNYGDAYILKGDIYAMQDNGGEAATWYGQCMTMDPKNPQGYISYANVYQKIDPVRSAETLKKLKEVNPEYPYEAMAGYTFYSNGKYDKAYDLFKQTDPNKLEEYIYVAYAITDYMVNKKDEALTLSESGLQKFPKDATFHRVAVWSAVDIEKFDVALQHAQVIMGTDSIKKTSRDYTYYGMALVGNKQYDEGIAQYEKALQLKADDPKPLQYISEAYKQKGDEDKALEYSQQYMDKNPDAAPTDFMKLAEIYVNKAKKNAETKVQNIEKAISVYDKLAEKYPSLKAFAKLQEGNTAFQSELDDMAIPAYDEVIKELEAKQCDADEVGYLKQAYQYMGFIYNYDKQDFEKAKPYWEKLLQLDPENKYAKDAIEKGTKATAE
mgnify:FL=1